jgi:hypothetical protein
MIAALTMVPIEEPEPKRVVTYLPSIVSGQIQQLPFLSHTGFPRSRPKSLIIGAQGTVPSSLPGLAQYSSVAQYSAGAT